MFFSKQLIYINWMAWIWYVVHFWIMLWMCQHWGSRERSVDPSEMSVILGKKTTIMSWDMIVDQIKALSNSSAYRVWINKKQKNPHHRMTAKSSEHLQCCYFTTSSSACSSNIKSNNRSGNFKSSIKHQDASSTASTNLTRQLAK